jgi:hypothetical protein
MSSLRQLGTPEKGNLRYAIKPKQNRPNTQTQAPEKLSTLERGKVKTIATTKDKPQPKKPSNLKQPSKPIQTIDWTEDVAKIVTSDCVDLSTSIVIIAPLNLDIKMDEVINTITTFGTLKKFHATAFRRDNKIGDTIHLSKVYKLGDRHIFVIFDRARWINEPVTGVQAKGLNVVSTWCKALGITRLTVYKERLDSSNKDWYTMRLLYKIFNGSGTTAVLYRVQNFEDVYDNVLSLLLTNQNKPLNPRCDIVRV